MNDVKAAATAPSRATGDDYSFTDDVRSLWRQLPNKGLFFLLLLAWLALFHFLGNSTLGYTRTPSLFSWMLNAYVKQTEVQDDGHGVIIPLVVIGLAWWKRGQLISRELRDWWPGILVLLAATGLHVLGYVVQEARISIIAFFIGLYGLMGLAWGWNFLRASFFPYVMFAFMVPLGSLTEKVTFPLRILVTKLVVFIGQWVLSADIAAVGTQLVNPSLQYQYEIAVPCSGMRSLIAITIIAVIYAYIALKGTWPRVFLVAAALPLAVIGNTFRMLLIVLASQIGGQTWGNFVHDNSAFSISPYVPAIFGLIWLGGKLEKRQLATPSPVEVRP